ncbi:MAG: hypothetical protein WDW36_005997 [Sanguina aurantia]
MVSAIGQDSKLGGFAAIIDLTRTLNRKFSAPGATQAATRQILKSLFPSWLPAAFKVMFSQPFREFSCRLNAFATFLTCQWLMGPCKVNDIEIDGGSIGVGHGVLVERCRYLEQAGCAAICTNSCKLPTQEFFAKDMGLPLEMVPNYEDYSCQFSFGKTPSLFQRMPLSRHRASVNVQPSCAKEKLSHVTTSQSQPSSRKRDLDGGDEAEDEPVTASAQRRPTLPAGCDFKELSTSAAAREFEPSILNRKRLAQDEEDDGPAVPLKSRKSSTAAAAGGRADGRASTGATTAAKAKAGAAKAVEVAEAPVVETEQWVQCTKCETWRVVPDENWEDIQTAGDDEDWYCKDALWDVSQHVPHTAPCH